MPRWYFSRNEPSYPVNPVCPGYPAQISTFLIFFLDIFNAFVIK